MERQESKVERMVEDSIRDHGGAYSRQFGVCLSWWRGIFEWICHLQVEVPRIQVWLVDCQANWRTYWGSKK
jgi:hypothetical protein